MLKRTKMGGEIHIAQASMLSTRACFRAVNPTSTYCKGKLRTRYLLRHFKYLHSRESQGKKGNLPFSRIFWFPKAVLPLCPTVPLSLPRLKLEHLTSLFFRPMLFRPSTLNKRTVYMHKSLALFKTNKGFLGKLGGQT